VTGGRRREQSVADGLPSRGDRRSPLTRRDRAALQPCSINAPDQIICIPLLRQIIQGCPPELVFHVGGAGPAADNAHGPASQKPRPACVRSPAPRRAAPPRPAGPGRAGPGRAVELMAGRHCSSGRRIHRVSVVVVSARRTVTAFIASRLAGVDT